MIEYQKKGRELCCPRKLFELWEEVCYRYERREITIYDLEEMKEVIWPNLQALATLRRIVNAPDEVPVKRQARRKRA